MLKAIRALRFKNSSRNLQDNGDDGFGEILKPEDQFMLVIPRAEVDRPSKTNIFGLTRVCSPMNYNRPQLSGVSSLTTQSDTTSLGLTTRTSAESKMSRRQDPPSFMESLGSFAGGMCGIVPPDDHNSAEGQANCGNTLCFVNDEIRTTITFGESTLATTMTEAGESSAGTQSFLTDGDDIRLGKAEARDVHQIAPKGKAESREEAVVATAPAKAMPLPSRKGRPQERKKELLRKLFRARRDKKARADVAQHQTSIPMS